MLGCSLKGKAGKRKRKERQARVLFMPLFLLSRVNTNPFLSLCCPFSSCQRPSAHGAKGGWRIHQNEGWLCSAPMQYQSSGPPMRGRRSFKLVALYANSTVLSSQAQNFTSLKAVPKEEKPLTAKQGRSRFCFPRPSKKWFWFIL